MKTFAVLILSFLLCSCSLKLGNEKKGGAIEYLENNYSTKTRMPFPGGGVYLNMERYLYPMVVKYCYNQNARLIENWCVDQNQKPLFRLTNTPSGTVPVYVNGTSFNTPMASFLVIIERSDSMTDAEWLAAAINKYEFDPRKIAAGIQAQQE